MPIVNNKNITTTLPEEEIKPSLGNDMFIEIKCDESRIPTDLNDGGEVVTHINPNNIVLLQKRYKNSDTDYKIKKFPYLITITVYNKNVRIPITEESYNKLINIKRI